jgi:hypothetical protein
MPKARSSTKLRVARRVLQCAADMLLAARRDAAGKTHHERWLEAVESAAFAACTYANTGTEEGLRSLRAALRNCRRLIHTPTAQLLPLGDKARVTLNGSTDPVIVTGQEQPTLNGTEYDVVRVLLDAGKDGLSKHRLNQKTGLKDARKVLARLRRKSAAWHEVIHMPGMAGGRYILW